jgi:hypothetical protein
MEMHEGELTLFDEEGQIKHVFERGDLSRAAYQHMCSHVKLNFDSKLTPEENWAKAEAAWDSLTYNEQMHLWNLSFQDEKQVQSICENILVLIQGSRECIQSIFIRAIDKVMKEF